MLTNPRYLIFLLALLPGVAGADFHFMLIREVYAGSSASPDAQYVELQMYQAGQNKVAGRAITVFDPSGVEVGGPYTFPSDVPNGANQASLLIATPAAEAAFGLEADLAMDAVLQAAGGKVCFEDVDCFAWGSYGGDASAPSPSGTPFQAASGIAPGKAASRDISGGNPSLLEGSDDTDDSAADFIEAEPAPSNNAESSPPDDPETNPPPYGGEGGGSTGGGGYGGGGGSWGLWLLLPVAAAGRRFRTVARGVPLPWKRQ